MKNLTVLEKIVFNAILENTFDEYGATTEDISKVTKLEINTVKGVQGSLNKKGLIENDEREVYVNNKIVTYSESFPIIEGVPVSFGCDTYDEKEWSTFYKSV